ncbi:Helicase associated domain protein [Streptomyces sp. NBC_01637]|uniref:DEAD/DEAH box helicase n=1 Tax=unclassified Streptomyces TaxID=2593676 RepID=UPI00386FCAFA|nr:Helicase associated domain protein [Streptomyces sp. NBC_01653]WTC84628.1 Helicase associated domain protein [Streptomyces sp. NBC_01653]WTD86240.1 Helicase associated domain protein [Streptomyces sp. NBC_01637]WTD94285.1 Helicase associated domain protein [Streptomyces sp. NBC_01637]
MAVKELRPHQREAVDAVLRALELPAQSLVPERGLRTQVVMATGSGKTLVAVRSAQELRAGRVLVLVPSLDLLTQTEAAWREGGRTGPVIGVSSLRGEEVSFPNTTDVDELVEWARPFDKVTVFATYASLGLGTLERAHAAGLPGWDLIVVDEAHRTSGRIGKPWAVVHDNQKIPALRRLYMTATPRLWQLGDEDQEQGAPGELVASMDDDPNGPFGSRCYTLTLSAAIDRGICSPYQVVCVDVTDTQLQAAQLLGAEARSEAVRGTRLAALQTALLKASAEEGFRRTLVFHHMVKEAEAFAAGLPDVAAQLHVADPELYPRTVWADWLCGEHKPLHRRRVLDEFASGIAGDGTVVEKGYLGSVKVLGEGVDTRNCDSVYFADVRGSMPDLVQAVGRALRMQPGEGKTASLVVPVLLGPGETADNMLTSRAYGGLAKLLEALRAHDTRIVEALAEQQAPSRAPKGRELGDQGEGQEQQGPAWQGVSSPAKALLKFSTPRDPATLAAFINLRVLNPEHQHWRRGIEAATTYHRLHDDLRVPFTYRVHHGKETGGAESGAPGGTAVEAEFVWPASLANFPLGQWTADARRFHARGDMDQDRAAQLEKLGMIWSHYDVAWEEGLTAARGWASEHGHLLAPLDATHQGYRVGIWLKNQRAAARRAAENEQRRAEGLPVQSSAGALSTERREQLEDIDASWCPAWPVAWQRAFHLTRQHLDAGGTLPTAAGDVVHQGEDLGHWVTAQRIGWDKLTGVQQWMLEHILGITPASEDEKPKPRTSQADKWALHLTAATQYYEREGHLRVPRKHVETLTIGGPSDGDGEGQKQQEQRDIKLGAWINNQRTRATTLSPERVEQLSTIGMRWT